MLPDLLICRPSWAVFRLLMRCEDCKRPAEAAAERGVVAAAARLVQQCRRNSLAVIQCRGRGVSVACIEENLNTNTKKIVVVQ